MSCVNPLWGASRIHGELLKLGFEVASERVDYHCKACTINAFGFSFRSGQQAALAGRS
jgi:hypothetical protein